MNEDYLWDRSGEPDEQVVHLEELLGELSWSEKRRNLPRVRQVEWWHERRWWAVAAATVLLGIGTAIFVHRMHTTSPVTSWQLSLTGRRPSTVRTGQVIETVGVTHGILKSEFVGEVKIEPNSRLRLLAAGEDEQRLALDHGTIHALIWAPPTKFVVDTPSAKTVDLGCQYTLRVAKDGTGFLMVEMGWVAFQWHNIESFIPAGAACTTRPGHGPDTPHFVDSPKVLTEAVAQFDLTGNARALNTALSAARPRDALTLWHLLQRTEGEERGQVFDRFRGLVNLPSSLTRDSILSGDSKSMDAAWDALQLGNTSWWRGWKREW